MTLGVSSSTSRSENIDASQRAVGAVGAVGAVVRSVVPYPSSHLAVAVAVVSQPHRPRIAVAPRSESMSRRRCEPQQRRTARMQLTHVKYRVITEIHAVTRPTGCGTLPGASTGVISLGSRWRPKFRAQCGRPPSSTHRVLSTTNPGPDQVHQLRNS